MYVVSARMESLPKGAHVSLLGWVLHLNCPLQSKELKVEALVDTGCPATIISKTLCRQILDSGEEQNDPSYLERRRQRARILHLNKPSLQLHAYCGTHLSIGAEITIDLKVGECQARGIVLVQQLICCWAPT